MPAKGSSLIGTGAECLVQSEQCEQSAFLRISNIRFRMRDNRFQGHSRARSVRRLFESSLQAGLEQRRKLTGIGRR